MSPTFGDRQALGKPIREAFPDLEGEELFEILDQVYATGEPHVGHAVRFLRQRASGMAADERFIDFVFQPVTDADGAVSGIFVPGSDVTQQVVNGRMSEQARQAAEAVARHATTLAMTDPLTGLANRRKTMQALDDAIAQAAQAGGALSVVLFDVDHFKRINDAWGHAVGDEVLCRVAQSAETVVRGGSVVGRIGGEEVLVLLPRSGSSEAITTAELIRAAIQIGGCDPGLGFTVSASFGVASLRAGETGHMVLRRADLAFYEAKQAGRNIVRSAV